ncbi:MULTISPECIES: hypothetical protein [Staphylococcus]|uniref:Yip1 domain-containing protein n=1 Tax=Staphylococcus hsinchuensis TaxID=3051183 RepID=A0ABZ3EBM8_9STAP|nr:MULTISPECIES: hypothetical protein [unclassified Staphylococcus]
MENSSLPFAKHFYNLRQHRKWALKLLIFIILTILLTVVTTMGLDFDKTLQKNDIVGKDLDNAKNIMMYGAIIGGIFSSLVSLLSIFILIVIISKIAKYEVSGTSIFSAAILKSIIITIFSLVFITIQLVFGLSLTDYTITSLNIFDKGNKILGAINLQTILSAYLFGLILFATCRFSKKTSLIFGILYLIISMGLAILGASFN